MLTKICADWLKDRGHACHKPHLEQKKIDLWHFEIPENLDDSLHDSAVLSESEKKKADEFSFKTDAQRYIYCRENLRYILSLYERIKPSEIVLMENPFGKPYLNSYLNFNLSHNRKHMVLGVSFDRSIGLDSEEIRPIPELSLIAEFYFNDRENAFLNSLNFPQKTIVFLSLWTKREALLKAWGIGLAEGLEMLKSINLLQEKPRQRILEVKYGSRIWKVRKILFSPNCIGAMAYSA